MNIKSSSYHLIFLNVGAYLGLGLITKHQFFFKSMHSKLKKHKNYQT